MFKRQTVATIIAFFIYETFLLIGLATVYFTTAIAVSILALIGGYFLALKWLDYVFPRKKQD